MLPIYWQVGVIDFRTGVVLAQAPAQGEDIPDEDIPGEDVLGEDVRGEDKKELPGTETLQPQQLVPEQGRSVPWVWIAVGAVVLIGAVLAAALLKKRGKNKVEVKNKMPAMENKSAAKAAGQFAIGNAHHIGGRDEQQDSFGISDISDAEKLSTKGLLAVVADGMGGLTNGAEVSRLVVKTMLGTFAQSGGDMDPAVRLVSLVEEANRQVNRYLNGGSGSGSTVVAALILGGGLYTVSVGDSRIYMLRGSSLMQLNREHVYGAELDEMAARGHISYDEAASDPQRRALTSYIGMGEIAKIDRNVYPLALQRGDKIALMSDGIFATLSDQDLERLLVGEAHQAAADIEKAVLERKKSHQDNFTVIVLEYR